MLYWVHLALEEIELTTLVVVGTDYIGGYKIQQPYDHDLDGPYSALWYLLVKLLFYMINIEWLIKEFILPIK